jgi:trk system potassium uptake protein TrkA
MAALIAKRMFNISKVICRIYDPPRGQMYKELGVQTVIPTTLGAKMIRDTLMETPWNPVQPFDFGKVTSLSVRVAQADAGRRIADVERPGRIRIAALRRKTSVMVADGDVVLEADDEINAIVAPDAVSEFAQMFNNSVPAMSA